MITIKREMLKTAFIWGLFSILVGTAARSQDSINLNGYNVFYYENGIKSSEGNFVDGMPDGLWKNYYRTGALKSIGYRDATQLDSLWKFYREDGVLIEEIQYDSNLRNGITKKYNEEGFLVSKTPFKNDKRAGIELEYYPASQHLHFERPYQLGLLEGFGYEYAEDGRVISIIEYEKGYIDRQEYINRYDPKGRKNGMWIEFYEDLRFDENKKAKRLEGRYLEGLKNGYFREYDRTGSLLTTYKYENGELIKDPIELSKIEIRKDFYPDATVKREKKYLNGEPHGIWKEYDKDGNLINAQAYRNGILLGEGLIDEAGVKQGFWKEYYPDGSLRAEGEYLDGDRYKMWKFYFVSGKLEQKGKYRQGGRQHGEWVWYFEDGETHRIENFRKGEEDGEIIEYDSTGQVVLKGQYYDGLEDGEWFLQSGDYKEEGKFIEGRRHGEWVHTYLTTDEVAYEGEYIEGLEDGKHTWYYENGKKKLEGKYEMGMRQGDWRRFDENGLLILTISYKNNRDQKLDGKKIKPETE